MVRPIAIIYSDSVPLSGQQNRSSGNFSTKWYGDSTSVIVSVTGDSDAKKITFDIREDKKGTDPTIYNNVTDGVTLSYKDLSSLYISNPTNATSPFTVTLNPS